MLEKLAIIEARYNELNQLMEENMGDYTRVVELAKERAELDEIVHLTQQYRLVLQQLEDARQLQDADDEDLRMLAISELDELTRQSAILENQLKLLLVPKDPRDDRNIIVEIRAGTGGDEAGLFVADLFRMYVRYAERHN
ncbi:MAG TPA: PCRF domain-containing protein, partial [Anaerolineaceae bacterium]|nr:PCRF domain-containing protein [Anaerolineaceae bacterium]